MRQAPSEAAQLLQGKVLPFMPVDEGRKIIAAANGDSRIFADLVGHDRRYLEGTTVLYLEIKEPNKLGLRLASGNEAGSNELWIPGAKTSGGIPEPVIDLSNNPSLWNPIHIQLR